jgi:CubicO group peptidase (beta-lactamase class C family)
MNDQTITLANWDTPPFNRTSFLNISDLIPVEIVSRGDQPATRLVENHRELGAIAVPLTTGETSTVEDVLKLTETDGFLVLHRGQIVCEKYFNGMAADTLHLAQSVSKSVTGTLVGIYLERGLIDRNALVCSYVPELRNSGYADATLDHVINMQTGVKFSEDYLDPDAEFALLDIAAGWKDFRSEDDSKSIHDLLASIKGERAHGEYFQYRSIDTDVLAWICERVGGDSLAKLISAEIWSKIGAEHDASFTVDRDGTALADGGFNATLRDFGRFAQMYLDRGMVNGQQVASPDWVKGCQRGDSEAFRVQYSDFASHYPDAGYSNQWWVVDGTRGVYSARGVFGQFLYIDPIAELVVVKLSTWPTFLDSDRGLDTYRMAEAIAAHLA